MLTEYCELLAVMHFPLFFVCFTVKNDSFCCLVVVLSHGVFLATVVISTSAFDKREILNRKTPRVKEYLWTGPTPLPSLTPKSRPRDFTHFFYQNILLWHIINSMHKIAKNKLNTLYNIIRFFLNDALNIKKECFSVCKKVNNRFCWKI